MRFVPAGRPKAEAGESENAISPVFMRVERKRTAIHDQPFERECQWVLLAFHRFFAGFMGFLGV
jgi:hypothetical protein